MTDAAIFVEGLSKRFEDIVAVDGIDLEVPAGSVLGMLGPNGAGKTTTVRMLTTIIRPDAGHARVLVALAWCLGITAVFAALSVRRYRRSA